SEAQHSLSISNGLGPRRFRWALAVLAALGILTLGVFAGRRAFVSSAVLSFQRLTFHRGEVLSARFAPDGQTIVYSAAWEGSPSDLFTTRPGATESRSLGLPGAGLLAISSTSEMAFQLGAKSLGGPVVAGTLARASLSGGVPRELFESVQGADWSPDGKLAIVRDVGDKSRLEYPPGTALAEVPLPGAFWKPRVSRAGDRIAVLEFADRTAHGRLVVIDRLGKKEDLSARTDQTGFAWSPSGGEVWFNNLQGLFSITIGGSQRILYSSPMPLYLHDVSPDGRLLVSLTQLRGGIMVLSPHDSAERDLSWLDRSGIADLSSDGRILLFNETLTAGSNEVVYVRPVDGSAAVRLGEGWATAFTADGRSALTIPPDG